MEKALKSTDHAKELKDMKLSQVRDAYKEIRFALRNFKFKKRKAGKRKIEKDEVFPELELSHQDIDLPPGIA